MEIPGGIGIGREYWLGGLCVWIDPIDNTRGFIEG